MCCIVPVRTSTSMAARTRPRFGTTSSKQARPAAVSARAKCIIKITSTATNSDEAHMLKTTFRLTRVALVAIGASVALLVSTRVQAQVGDISGVTYPNWIPSDRVAPTVTTSVVYDDVAQVWRYAYGV